MREYCEFKIDDDFVVRVVEISPDACEAHFRFYGMGLKRFYVNIHLALQILEEAYENIYSNAPQDNDNMTKIAKRLGFEIVGNVDGYNVFKLMK